MVLLWDRHLQSTASRSGRPLTCTSVLSGPSHSASSLPRPPVLALLPRLGTCFATDHPAKATTHVFVRAGKTPLLQSGATKVPIASDKGSDIQTLVVRVRQWLCVVIDTIPKDAKLVLRI